MFLGIDFSGGAAPWRPRCVRPTVWIATIAEAGPLRLTDLRPVQQLPGDGVPFARLTARLGAGDYAAAGIDAPFALPAAHMPADGHSGLLARVGALETAPDRPFPSGAALVALAETIAPLGKRKKPYRETERMWVKRGVATRSTLWNGARGGAPFTAACLTLLARAGRPVWPWRFGPGMLVEAFPAAQLSAWGLPHRGYGRPEQQAVRAHILDRLAARLDFDSAQRAEMHGSADALDAVLAAFGAIAAVQAGAPADPPPEGLIAVLDDAPRDRSMP